MGIKTYQEKNTKPMKKLELNRAYQLWEKSKKPPKNTVYQKSYKLGMYFNVRFDVIFFGKDWFKQYVGVSTLNTVCWDQKN